MSENNLNIEECPLRNHSQPEKRPRRNLKGPLRVVRLCLLGIVLPAFLLGVPIYMRYRVYGLQLYPLAVSDMRMLDNRVSTTWCQRQLVGTNTTFNAFLMPEPPELSGTLKIMSMVRHLILEDDIKEYWGFYLLRGSSVTVSTCVRWPGASLIVIRGHKHLQECAYIGDDSSEELDELEEAIREGTYVAKNEKILNKTVVKKVDQPVNEPELMKRHRPNVEFHSPIHKNNLNKYALDSTVDTSDVTDPKKVKEILETINTKKSKWAKNHVHFKRNSTIAKNETNNLDIQAPNSQHLKTSQEIMNEILRKLEGIGDRGSRILENVNKKFKTRDTMEPVRDTVGRHYSKPSFNYSDVIDLRRRKREALRNIVTDLNKDDDANNESIEEEMESDEEIDKRRKLIESTYLDLNEHDELNNHAIEDGFSPSPDGIADHRGTVNETTDNDMSNSEFWSSFSSSEEALLNCAGLILNLPLTPHHKCDANLTEEEAEETYLANSITYKVPSNGYYFFVFNSENEVQPNYIRVHFHLSKSVYNVSNPVSFCRNSSETCAMDLNFLSSEKLVIELPENENDTLWNEEYIVVSECEPRTAIYAVCVMTVPVLVVLFAFS